MAFGILAVLFVFPATILAAFNRTVGDPLIAQSDRWQAEAKKTHDEYDMQVAREVHDIVNQERVNRGKQPLAWDDGLAATARTWSKFMYETDRFEHSTLFCHGENILMTSGGSLTAKEAVSSWMDSPGHRENILRESFHSEGIGIYRGYATQNFC